MTAYREVMRERACTSTSPKHAQYEAETVVSDYGPSYLVLRCTECGRPQGMRLIRKKVAS